MASSLSSVRYNLQSEKPAERSRAVKILEQALAEDRSHIISEDTDQVVSQMKNSKSKSNKTNGIKSDNASLWRGVTQSILAYEIKEIEASHKKKKPMPIANSNIIKKYFKHMIKYHPSGIASTLPVIIEHYCHILDDVEVPQQHKEDIALSLLIDMAQTRLYMSIEYKYVKKLFMFLKDEMVDEQSISNAYYNRLLKGICCSLLRDDLRPQADMIKLIKWIISLVEKVANIPSAFPIIFSTATESLIHFLEFDGANTIYLVPTEVMADYFSFVAKVLNPEFQFSESMKNNAIKIFSLYLDITFPMMSFTAKPSKVSSAGVLLNDISIIEQYPLFHSISYIYGVVFSEENMRSFTLDYTQFRNHKDFSSNIEAIGFEGFVAHKREGSNIPVCKYYYNVCSYLAFIHAYKCIVENSTAASASASASGGTVLGQVDGGGTSAITAGDDGQSRKRKLTLLHGASSSGTGGSSGGGGRDVDSEEVVLVASSSMVTGANGTATAPSSSKSNSSSPDCLKNIFDQIFTLLSSEKMSSNAGSAKSKTSSSTSKIGHSRSVYISIIGLLNTISSMNTNFENGELLFLPSLFGDISGGSSYNNSNTSYCYACNDESSSFSAFGCILIDNLARFVNLIYWLKTDFSNSSLLDDLWVDILSAVVSLYVLSGNILSNKFSAFKKEALSARIIQAWSALLKVILVDNFQVFKKLCSDNPRSVFFSEVMKYTFSKVLDETATANTNANADVKSGPSAFYLLVPELRSDLTRLFCDFLFSKHMIMSHIGNLDASSSYLGLLGSAFLTIEPSAVSQFRFVAPNSIGDLQHLLPVPRGKETFLSDYKAMEAPYLRPLLILSFILNNIVANDNKFDKSALLSAANVVKSSIVDFTNNVSILVDSIIGKIGRLDSILENNARRQYVSLHDLPNGSYGSLVLHPLPDEVKFISCLSSKSFVAPPSRLNGGSSKARNAPSNFEEQLLSKENIEYYETIICLFDAPLEFLMAETIYFDESDQNSSNNFNKLDALAMSLSIVYSKALGSLVDLVFVYNDAIRKLRERSARKAATMSGSYGDDDDDNTASSSDLSCLYGSDMAHKETIDGLIDQYTNTLWRLLRSQLILYKRKYISTASLSGASNNIRVEYLSSIISSFRHLSGLTHMSATRSKTARGFGGFKELQAEVNGLVLGIISSVVSEISGSKGNDGHTIDAKSSFSTGSALVTSNASSSSSSSHYQANRQHSIFDSSLSHSSASSSSVPSTSTSVLRFDDIDNIDTTALKYRRLANNNSMNNNSQLSLSRNNASNSAMELSNFSGGSHIGSYSGGGSVCHETSDDQLMFSRGCPNRITPSATQEKVLLSLCSIFASTQPTAQVNVEVILRSISDSEKHHISSDLLLKVINAVSCINPTLSLIHECFVSFWDQELGYYGHLMILATVYNIVVGINDQAFSLIEKSFHFVEYYSSSNVGSLLTLVLCTLGGGEGGGGGNNDEEEDELGLAVFFDRSFFLRMLRITCICKFLKICKDSLSSSPELCASYITKHKTRLSDMYLAYISDSDSRLRFHTIKYTAFMMSFYKKSEKIYERLVIENGVRTRHYTNDDGSLLNRFDEESMSSLPASSMLQSDANLDGTVFCSTIFMLLSLGQTHECLMKRSLIDIIGLCTYEKIVDPFAFASYDYILSICIEKLSTSYKFESSIQFIEYALPSLMHEWIYSLFPVGTKVTRKNVTSMDDEVESDVEVDFFFPLRFFPFQILDSKFDNIGRSGETVIEEADIGRVDRSIEYFFNHSLYRAMLEKYLYIIVPMICTSQGLSESSASRMDISSGSGGSSRGGDGGIAANDSLRWQLVECLVNDLHCNWPNDALIQAVFRKLSTSMKALQYLQFAEVFATHLYIPNNSLDRISAFLDRISRVVDKKTNKTSLDIEENQFHDLVIQCLRYFNSSHRVTVSFSSPLGGGGSSKSNSPVPSSSAVDGSSFPAVCAEIRTVFDYIIQANGISMQTLFCECCSLVDIFAYLLYMAKLSRTVADYICLCASVQVILVALDRLVIDCLLYGRSFLRVVIQIMNSEYSLLAPILSIFEVLINIVKSVAKESKGTDSKSTLGFLREIYCELAYLRAAVQIRLDSSLVRDTGCCSSSDGGEVVYAVDSNLMLLCSSFKFMSNNKILNDMSNNNSVSNSSNGNNSNDNSPHVSDIADDSTLATLDHLLLSLSSLMNKLYADYSAMILSMTPSLLLSFVPAELKYTLQAAKDAYKKDSLDLAVRELLILLPLYIDGFMVSDRAIFSTILHLKDLVSADTIATSSIWQTAPLKVGQLITLLTRLCVISPPEYASFIPPIVVFIIGSFGISDSTFLTFESMNSKNCETRDYNINNMKVSLLQLIYRRLCNGESIDMWRTYSAIMNKASFSDFFELDKELMLGANGIGVLLKSYSKLREVDGQSYTTPASLLLASTTMLSKDPIGTSASSMGSSAKGSRALRKKTPVADIIAEMTNPIIWNSKDISYQDWVMKATSSLIYQLSRENSSTSGSIRASADAISPLTLDINNLNDFLISCIKATSFDFSLAELLFPLVLFCILQRYGNSNPEVRSLLAQVLMGFVFGESCHLREIRKLGCRAMLFLFRMNMSLFIRSNSLQQRETNKDKDKDSSSTYSSRSSTSRASLLSPNNNLLLPYDFGLPIDIRKVADVALDSNMFCSALMLYEICLEDKCFSEEGDVNASASSSSSSSIFKPRAASRRDNKTDKATFFAEISESLLKIYSSVDDPDLIHGVSNKSDLFTQASLYMHDGMFTEALSTFESISQSRGSRIGVASSSSSLSSNSQPLSRSTTASSAKVQSGVLSCLKGLGCKELASAYSRSSAMGGGGGVDDVGFGFGQDGFLHASLSASNSFHGNFDALDSALRRNIEKNPTSFSSLEEWSLPNDDASYGSSELISSSQSAVLMDGRLNSIISSNLTFSSINRFHIDRCKGQINVASFELIEQLSKYMEYESSKFLISEISNSRKLVEFKETLDSLYGQSVQDSSGLLLSQSSLTELSLADRWRSRCVILTRNTFELDNSISHRLPMIQKLVEFKRIEAYEALQVMTNLTNVIKNKTEAHALHPVLFKLHDILFPESASDKFLNLDVMDPETEFAKVYWKFEDCKFLFHKGLVDVALASMKSYVLPGFNRLFDGLSSSSSTSSSSSSSARTGHLSVLLAAIKDLLSNAYRLVGDWTSGKRAATGTDIIKEFLAPATDIATPNSDASKKAHLAMAQFSLRLYFNTKARIESNEWISHKKRCDDRELEMKRCLELQRSKSLNNTNFATSSENKSLIRYLQGISKELASDQEQYTAIENAYSTHIMHAITNFGKVLARSTESDLDIVFQIINLWFSNSDNSEVNEAMLDIFNLTASYKFAPLAYQIFSRLGDLSAVQLADNLKNISATSISTATLKRKSSTSSSSSGSATVVNFQYVLNHLIIKLCTDHPYHILPILFALANESSLGTAAGAQTYQENMSQHRLKVAKDYVNYLKNNPRTAGLTSGMERILKAYIDLANAPIDSCLQKFGNICKNATISDLNPAIWQTFNMAADNSNGSDAHGSCYVLTVAHPLQPDRDYSTIKRIKKFEPKFQVTETGVSRPKIIRILDTDGRMHQQLVKGGDDTRQDAVMQQVFEYVNYNFGRIDESRKRRLSIRCYKVVPTSPQTGVLEWVENTKAFGSNIVDAQGTHQRYRPKDWPYKMCKDKIGSATTRQARLQVFEDVCRNFKPSFRYFFLEKFADPMEWSCRRLQYTRSVATTSMVGYVLGIGDRHSFNILVDNHTADVIHIDFGMVFEQGSTLPIPEVVPFRLTREIIDGMGVSGVEGAFRRSSEEVLKVLREFSGQLNTILEVVIHDPLFRWCMSPVDARKKQTEPRAKANVNATTTASEGGGGGGGKDKDKNAVSASGKKDKKSPAAKGKGAKELVEENIMETDEDVNEDDDLCDNDAVYVGDGSNFPTATATITTVMSGGGNSMDTAGGSGSGGGNLSAKTDGKKSIHDAATRALAKVQLKLQGLEDPAGEPFSADGHVSYLIESATAAENLSQLFYGWAAWL